MFFQHSFFDGESQTARTVEAKENITTSVDLFFEDAVSCNQFSDLYIEVEETTNSEDNHKTKFKFDSMVIFLKE